MFLSNFNLISTLVIWRKANFFNNQTRNTSKGMKRFIVSKEIQIPDTIPSNYSHNKSFDREQHHGHVHLFPFSLKDVQFCF